MAEGGPEEEAAVAAVEAVVPAKIFLSVTLAGDVAEIVEEEIAVVENIVAEEVIVAAENIADVEGIVVVAASVMMGPSEAVEVAVGVEAESLRPFTREFSFSLERWLFIA